MATRFYLSSTMVPDISPAFGAWDRTTEGARRVMLPTKDGSAMTTATIWDGAAAAASEQALSRQFISPPMIAGIAFAIATDTIKVQVRVAESGADDNVNRPSMNLRVIASDGSTVRTTLKGLGHYGPTATEWIVTTLTNDTFADGDAVIADYTTVAGDRLVLEIGGRVSAAGGTGVTGSMSFGSDSATDLPEDETTTTANNPWFEISRDISFLVKQLAAMGVG